MSLKRRPSRRRSNTGAVAGMRIIAALVVTIAFIVAAEVVRADSTVYGTNASASSSNASAYGYGSTSVGSNSVANGLWSTATGADSKDRPGRGRWAAGTPDNSPAGYPRPSSMRESRKARPDIVTPYGLSLRFTVFSRQGPG